MQSDPVVEVERLCKVFETPAGPVRAVDDVSFAIPPGETLGLVGESGSGKSTVARLVTRLQEPTSGTVRVHGRDLATVPRSELRSLRLRMQMVFQNPYGSLLPHYTAGANVAEPLRLHRLGTADERRREALRLLDLVEVGPRLADRYPSQLSGGQQQRVAIARALALSPDLLVCDEVTSALDVSIQAQILNLLEDIHAELRFSCLFISHNLAVVERLATRVVVMCRGQVVEQAETRSLFGHPQHPYTLALLCGVLPVTADVSSPTPPPTPAYPSGDLREVSSGHWVRSYEDDALRTGE